MVAYFSRRLIYGAATVWIISIISFVMIELPPGDLLTSHIMRLEARGLEVNEQYLFALEKEYGLNLPVYLRYFGWLWRALHGNFGRSFGYGLEVKEVIAQRLPATLMLSLFTTIFTYAVAIPIGIYAATHQYSIGDYSFTLIGFVGLATPNFMLALILMAFFFYYFGLSPGGLFSPEYALEAWSPAKFVDMLKHLPIPIIVIGTAGTAGLIRVMRGCLLDELNKQYVITARAKGVSERTLLFKYPVRLAINPIISTVGWILPAIISGEVITSVVLNLPTLGATLLDALLGQDMYLAGTILLIMGSLTVVGMIISDLLLAWIDPRIRYGRQKES